MRTENSIKNITIGIISQIIITLLGFVSRKIFLDSLGAEYLGVNGLLTNVLSMLAIIESGIGTSIVYSLYKPLAEKNESKIIALVQLYKKSYFVLAALTLILSLTLYPFLDVLINDGKVPYITVIYFIFVAKNITYYLNAHKVALISADQKGYVLTRINIGFQIITYSLKIIILVATKNYVLFLGLELLTFVIQNIFNGIIVNKRYYFIKTKIKSSIEIKEKKGLIKNVKALFLHNIGEYVAFSTDNILISMFIGLKIVGLYSNYSMIITQLGSLLSPLTGGIGASVGNLLVTEKNEKQYLIFKVSFLMNFWIYSISVIFLYNLLEPFINWWLGKGYLLDPLTFMVILLNFYLSGVRSSIITFKTKGGIFLQDKYVPLIGAAINLGASLILVRFIGLSGIFIGTTISTFCVFWVGPFLVYKHIFKVPVWTYFIKFSLYIMLTIFCCLITKYSCKVIVDSTDFLSLIESGVVCLAIPSFVYLLIFYKTTEFRYIQNILRNITSSLWFKIPVFRARINQK